MTKKRRNNGRSKHGRGMTASVLCNGCGCKPKKDKAVKRFIVKNMVDTSSLRDIKEACIVDNYQVPKMYHKQYYCVGCAIHRRVVRVRSVEGRKNRDPPPRHGAPRPAGQQAH